MTTSTSHVATNAASVADWFIPAPMARTTPWSRSSMSAPIPDVDASSQRSSGFMEVGDVERVKPQALQTAFHRAQDPVAREIPFAPVRGGHREAAVISLPCAFRRGHQDPSHLGREGVLLPRVGAQEGPKPAFRKPQSIVRCGVEITHAASPRGVDRRGARCSSVETRLRLPSWAPPRPTVVRETPRPIATLQCELPPYRVLLILHHTSSSDDPRRGPSDQWHGGTARRRGTSP